VEVQQYVAEVFTPKSHEQGGSPYDRYASSPTFPKRFLGRTPSPELAEGEGARHPQLGNLCGKHTFLYSHTWKGPRVSIEGSIYRRVHTDIPYGE